MDPCQNGGSCNRITGECQCPIITEGQLCENLFDPCQSDLNTCENDGICFVEENSINCDCPPGFRGDRCERVFDPCGSHPCENFGTCIQTGPEEFRCECVIGWAGMQCEEAVDPCEEIPDLCQNGGTCQSQGQEFQCECAPGFVGETCQLGKIYHKKANCFIQNNE